MKNLTSDDLKRLHALWITWREEAAFTTPLLGVGKGWFWACNENAVAVLEEQMDRLSLETI